MRTFVIGLLAATALSTSAFAQYDASQDIYHPGAATPAAGAIPFGQPTAPLSASEKAAIKAEAAKIKAAKEAAAERARKKKEEAAAKARAAREAAEQHNAPAEPAAPVAAPAPAMNGGSAPTPITTPSADDEAPVMPESSGMGAAPTAPAPAAPVMPEAAPAAPAAPDAAPTAPEAH